MQAQSSTPEIGTSTGERCAHYTDLRVRSLLRQEPGESGGWRWAIDPYQGCELACAFCRARIERKELSRWRSFERDIGVKTNAVSALLRDLSEPGAAGRDLVLGSATDPWQPAEEQFRLTRAVLTALCEVDGLGAVRANTRCSLVARDAELFKKLAAKTSVRIAISMASLDDGLSQVLEPRAPSPIRRLAALEALSLAGLAVDLVVSPVVVGLPEQERGLEALLTRAAHAGARTATLSLAEFEPGQRQSLFSHLSVAYPQLARRLRSLNGQRAHREEGRAKLLAAFDGYCRRLGLSSQLPATPSAPRHVAPTQLTLFDASTRH